MHALGFPDTSVRDGAEEHVHQGRCGCCQARPHGVFPLPGRAVPGALWRSLLRAGPSGAGIVLIHWELVHI